MSAIGYIQVHAFAGKSQKPLQDVSILITDDQGKAIAMRLTDRSGKIEPIPITVPDRSAGTSPNSGIIPFARVQIYARLENYEQIEAEEVQIFPGIITLQNLEMIPLSELPTRWTEKEIFVTPPQNL